ncbi:MAG TPA: outer membrane beta-barrel protein [Terriglobales bacterium]|nr:outer membrane beta-barrel protein [Terriglobales bacterium]
MTKVVVRLVVTIMTVGVTCASGQGNAKVDVFGGYSYASIDVNDLGDRQSANGWEASVSENVNRWFAVEGGVSGYYKGYDFSDPLLGNFHARLTDYFFGGGPRFNFRPLFAHALIGADRASIGISGVSVSQTKFATAFGGGVQFPVLHKMSIRASADYLLTRHNIFEDTSFKQNNFRVSVGLVYSFGGRRSSAASSQPKPSTENNSVEMQPHEKEPNISRPQASSGTAVVPALGVRVATYENGGAQIVEAAPGGVAALVGMRVGDVINALDGKTVKNAMELIAMLKDQAPGTKIKLGYLVRATWQTETLIIVGEPR